ncbi:hypothetical protein RJ639_040187 [Escallonia herrerae]|uniref:Uncharacterized protein n=1 Tax=Escallonia herrerae TaxID=1293975 RepID=A0AA89B2X0_9ASTE|nr:hypothetical protein RJ639_040187 [Escallonia herrerae]
MAISAAMCFPLYVTLLLMSKAAVVYSVHLKDVSGPQALLRSSVIIRGRPDSTMDTLRQEKVQRFEEFVDRRLKPDLVRAIAERNPNRVKGDEGSESEIFDGGRIKLKILCSDNLEEV